MAVMVETLDNAVIEAKRFLAAADRVKRYAGRTEWGKGNIYYCGGSYCSSLKRASMDLTKALVGVRS